MLNFRRLTTYSFVSFAIITLLHVWLNIGFNKLGLGGSADGHEAMRVGFLPVT